MSNSKSAIQEIKKLMVQFGFMSEDKNEIVKEIFIDAKLIDGTAIKVEGDSLLEGAKVVVVTADAEVPAPDGVHELEDGTKVETKDGVIVKVEEVVAEEEGVEAPEVPSLEEPQYEGNCYFGPSDGQNVFIALIFVTISDFSAIVLLFLSICRFCWAVVFLIL